VGDERFEVGEHRAARVPARDDLRSLLRRPWVQALLVGTAVVTTVGVTASKGKDGRGMEVVVAEAVLPSDGSVVVDESVEAAWRLRAMEREAQKLSAEFTRRGYRVTPELALAIHEKALKHEIDPKIAFGLVRAESGFRNAATSPVGAVGLTQLMPGTARWMEPGVTREELRNPETNLDIGFRYLRYLMDKYSGDETLALLAYNRGPGTVDRALRRGQNPDNGYAAFVRGEANHGHRLYTAQSRTPTAKARPAATAKRAAPAKARPASTAKRAAPAKARPASTAKRAAPAKRTTTAAARPKAATTKKAVTAKKAAPAKKAPPRKNTARR
jgi:hypothetical protein